MSNPTNDFEDLAFGDHLSVADNPGEWQQTAAGLFHAADICWNRWKGAENSSLPELAANNLEKVTDILLGPVAFHLLGTGIEVLLKSLAVAKQPGLALNKKSGLYSHDLIKVACLAEVQLTAEEEAVLERVRHWVEWVGRYPIPLLHHKSPTRLEVKEYEDLPASLTPEHWAAAVAFQCKLSGISDSSQNK